MTIYSWDEVEEIFFGEDKKNDLLVSVVYANNKPTYKCTVEFTFNPPQTANYKRLKQVSKVKYLRDLGTYLKSHIENVSYMEQTYETYESGFPHSHGYICIDSPTPYIIPGLVQDIARTYLGQLPGKHSRFNENDYHYKWDRFRCPSLVLQYRDASDKDRFLDWNTYIHKDMAI